VGQSKTIGAGEIHAAIERLAAAIVDQHGASARLLVLGIANGGIELARRLSARLLEMEPRLSIKPGTVDISFHRDDVSRNPIPKEFAPTHISGDVNGATIILVDDVLYSGRTIKAALDELFDHGRPTRVELAILVDRGGRRLPFAADYSGLTVAATETEKVIVNLDRKQPDNDQIRIEPTAARNSAL
jgi:pyrimidine operon attenuation protein/uracil phosphoribosyltransferase